MCSALVSVIMPAFNGERFIDQAIASMMTQSYHDWELIVVDDGSTDGTAEKVCALADSRIKYVFQPNQGQTVALNHGLRLARGDFVTTLDVDDWFSCDSLRDRARFLLDHPDIGVVYGDGVYCDEEGHELFRFSERMPTGVQGDVYEILIVSPFYGTGAGVMIRQTILDQLHLRYDESIVWCQDWDFYIRLAERQAFGYVDPVIINYRVHPSGMTLSMNQGKRLDSLIRLRRKVMGGARFNSVSVDQRCAFFYDFLIKDLSGRIDDQEAVFESGQFKKLPAHQQSRLIRLAADVYLRQDEHPDVVRRWFRMAWRRAPGNLKTGAVTALSTLSPGLAKSAVEKWQRRQAVEESVSPFELGSEPNH